MSFLGAVNGHFDLWNARETPLFTDANAKRLKALVKIPKAMERGILAGPCIGLLVAAGISLGNVRALWADMGAAKDAVVVVEDQADVEEASKFFFKELQVEGDGFESSLKK